MVFRLNSFPLSAAYYTRDSLQHTEQNNAPDEESRALSKTAYLQADLMPETCSL